MFPLPIQFALNDICVSLCLMMNPWWSIT